jgi:hypothetical protein
MSGSDSTVMVAGQLLDIVDDEWRADTLPFDGESPSRYHETRPDLTSRSIPPLPRFARRVIALTPARPVPNPQRYPCPRA